MNSYFGRLVSSLSILAPVLVSLPAQAHVVPPVAPAVRAAPLVPSFALPSAPAPALLGTSKFSEDPVFFPELPFGDEWCGTAVCGAPTPGQPRRFTGKERDSETGYHYFGARYYGASIGRFTTVDPVMTIQANLLNPQRWNRYAYALNNPLKYLDPDGRWPTRVKLVHQASIDRVLSFLPKEDRDILKLQQVVADENQTTEGAFMHAMRASDQDVEKAKSMANEYVTDELKSAQLFERLGAHVSALTHLGNAMHALQDGTSPQHTGFQPWNGEWGATSKPVRDHVAGEFFDPGAKSTLDEATGRAYEYFVGKRPLPKVFFPD